MKIPIIKIGNWWFFSKNVSGMALFPFIFISKHYADMWDGESIKATICHESIHIRQQMEMLVIPFYLWYGIEYLVKYVKYSKNAYRQISFEREAYENGFDYLEIRKFWAFLKYL